MPAHINVQTLPTTPDEISADWLSSVLGKSVTSFDLTSSILDQTAGKVFVAVRYDNGEAEKPRTTHLCLKGSFNPAMMSLAGYSDILLTMYTREVMFFNLAAPKLTTTRLPKVHWAGASTQPPQGILVMEDLDRKGYTFGNPAVPWSLKRVLAGVEQLATLHACTWNMSLQDLPGFAPAYEQVMIGLTMMWDSVVLGPDRPTVPDIIKDQKRVVAAMKKHYATKNPKFICLLHGDPHTGNTFLDQDDNPSFLDWQTCHIGTAFHDIAYFVVGSLSVADRRAHEMSILQHYLHALAKCGGPSLSIQDEDVVKEYKKSMMAGMGWVLTPYEMQRKECVIAMVERYCAALMDHRTIEVVESLPDPPQSSV